MVSSLTVVAPLCGLSTILGVSVLGSSVLGSSVMASTTIVEAYAQAVVFMQPLLSLVLIGLLVFLELTDPSYGGSRSMLVELRKSWLPVSALLMVLFFIIVALKVWNIIVG